MDSSQLLYMLFAVASISCSPEQNRTDEQTIIMKTIDDVGYKSFFVGDNPFHSFLLFVLFSMLVIIRNLPVSVAIFSMLLFLVSLRYKRWITHASCILVVSLIFLLNDTIVHILCLVIHIWNAGTALPTQPFCPRPSWYGVATRSYTAETPSDFLFSTGSTRRDIFQIIQDSVPGGIHQFYGLCGISTFVNILLIFVCAYLLLQIKKTTTRVFYLREFRFCFILEIFHFAVSFHSPLTLANTLIVLRGYAGMYVLAAIGFEISLCISICWICHSIFAKLPDTKRLSIKNR